MAHKTFDEYKEYNGHKEPFLFIAGELELLLLPWHLEAFRGEYKLLERQNLVEKWSLGTFHSYIIRDWDQFIWAVDAYYVTCYAPGCED